MHIQELPDAAFLVDAVTATEPVEGKITVFAPTNEAFAEIADVAADLSPEEILAVRLSSNACRRLLQLDLRDGASLVFGVSWF